MTAGAAGRVRVAVLISGAGSNMAALARATDDPACPFKIAVVISNQPDAAGLAVARALGVEAAVVDHRPFGKDREAHERAVHAVLEAHGAEIVALAGYMRLLTPWLVDRWQGRMLNVHPSLLPLYPGLDTHARALANGDAEAGCTIHLVTDGVDEGPVLAQARVRIEADDTAQSLSRRVLAAEHALYPRALADVCRARRGAV